MNKHSRYTMLLDVYRELLTEKQRSVMDQYYNFDLSMQEIAENEGISKQGVHDFIKRSERTLLTTEEKLKLLERLNNMQVDLKNLYSRISDISNAQCKHPVNTSLSAIKDELETIINKYTGG